MKANGGPAEGAFRSKVTDEGSFIGYLNYHSDQYDSGSALLRALISVPVNFDGIAVPQYDDQGAFDLSTYTSFGDGEHFLLSTDKHEGVVCFSMNPAVRPIRLLGSVKFPYGGRDGFKIVALGAGQPVVFLDENGRVYSVSRDGSAIEASQSLFIGQSFSRVERSGVDQRVWLTSAIGDEIALWDVAQGQHASPQRFTPKADQLFHRIPFQFGSGQRLSVVPLPTAGVVWFHNKELPGVEIYDLRRNAWLQADPLLQRLRLANVGRLSNDNLLCDAYRGMLYFAKADGSVLNDGAPYVGQYQTDESGFIKEFAVPNSPSGQRLLAIERDNQPATIVDTNGHRIAEVAGLTPKERIEEIYPASNLETFLLRTAASLSIVRAQGGLRREIPLAGEPSAFSHVYPIDDRSAWVLKDGIVQHVTISATSLNVQLSSWEQHHRCKTFDGFWPTVSPGRAWVQEEQTLGAYLIGADIAAEKLNLTVGGVALKRLPSSPAETFRVQPEKGLDLHFDGTLPFQADDAKPSWSVEFKTAAEKFVPTGMHKAQPGSSHLHIDWPSELTLPADVNVSVSFEDRFGTNLQAEWPLVTFAPAVSFFATPRGRAVVAWAIIVLLLLLSQHQTWRHGVRRYAPAIIAGIGSATASASITRSAFEVDLPWFWGLVIGSVVILAATGLISTVMLRRLAGVFPLDSAIPILLRSALIRRRYFAGYIDELHRRLMEERADAREEEYVAVPVEVQWPHTVMLSTDADVVLAAALLGDTRLLHRLSDGRQDPVSVEPANILIRSPGGQGKTALLRRLVEISIQRFRETGSSPIPLLCRAQHDSLADSARDALGGKYMIEGAFNAQLEDGFFLLVVDGLSEQAPPPSAIDSFVRGGNDSRLLLSSRPHVVYEAAYKTNSAGLIVEPQRLDNRTINRFEDAYLGQGQRLNPPTRAACAGPDGKYLPILVRLAAAATKAQANHLNTISDIFEAAFDALLKQEGQRAAAASLCLDTYWLTGSRTIAASIQKHKKLITQLKAAGLLVRVDNATNSASGATQELKFFHDSMQSYLTAEGLLNMPDYAGWALLVEAAGDRRFTEAGSELFQMCVQVFRPRDVLRAALGQELGQWADDHYDLFSADDISRAAAGVTGLPRSASLTIKEMLHAAVTACHSGQPTHSVAIERLAKIYGRLAPIVWSSRRHRMGGEVTLIRQGVANSDLANPLVFRPPRTPIFPVPKLNRTSFARRRVKWYAIAAITKAIGVGAHVPAIGKQRHGMRHDARRDLQQHHRDRDADHDPGAPFRTGKVVHKVVRMLKAFVFGLVHA